MRLNLKLKRLVSEVIDNQLSPAGPAVSNNDASFGRLARDYNRHEKNLYRRGQTYSLADRQPVPVKEPSKQPSIEDDIFQDSSNYHLPQVWASFLDRQSWDWFITVVPNDIIHPESFDKLWDVFIHHLNRMIYGKHYWKDKRKGVFWSIGKEYQRRGAVHGHGLIGGIPDYVSRNQFYNFLRNHGAQFSKIEQYQKNAGAEFYMSKSTYAWKRGEIDLSETMKHEIEGTRICGKVLHEAFLQEATTVNLRSASFAVR